MKGAHKHIKCPNCNQKMFWIVPQVTSDGVRWFRYGCFRCCARLLIPENIPQRGDLDVSVIYLEEVSAQMNQQETTKRRQR